tara:strand:+ start:508 stop:1290 length:783 start_codon:yes stop_codon:yes gene_type:complete
MAQIAEDYVSPSVRWGVLKQDYPEAVAEFSEMTGAELGIPEKFGGKDDYCVAQILLRPTDELPIVGYKPLSDAKSNKNDHPSDAWNVLCTKALGRALKRAGYADTAGEMKLIVTYKQRLAEHDAIRSGDEAQVANDSVPMPKTPEPSILPPPENTNPIASPAGAVTEVQADPEPVPVKAAPEPLVESDDWTDDDAMKKAHAELKLRVTSLPEDYAERARQAHEKLNKRQWPILKVSQFNAVYNIVESLHAEAVADAEPDF